MTHADAIPFEPGHDAVEPPPHTPSTRGPSAQDSPTRGPSPCGCSPQHTCASRAASPEHAPPPDAPPAGTRRSPASGARSAAFPGADPPDGPRVRAAAFFDLDKTLIATSAASVFARPLLRGRVLTRRAMLRSARAQLAFLLGSATEGRTERVRAELSRMVVGWDVDQVSAIVAASLPGAVEPVLYAEAVDLVRRHHTAGHDVVVVSASSEELVRPIAALIGADEVIASRMEVAAGRYTGRITFYAYGTAKATAMRDLATRRGYDLARSSAYSDSATDAPMLAAVGHGYLVNPGRTLRILAGERGWGTVTFRRRARTAPRRATVALALTGVGAGAVVWWRLVRRGRAAGA